MSHRLSIHWHVSNVEPWRPERLAAFGWRRLDGVWQASGRLDVWASGARLVHVWARLERLG
eukprot:357244-Prymnesium_polylepis.1